jgi:hypothetical protein
MPLAPNSGLVRVLVQNTATAPFGYVTATPSDGSPSVNQPIVNFQPDGAGTSQIGQFSFKPGELPDDTGCELTATAYDDQGQLCLAGPITVTVANPPVAGSGPV